MAPPKNTTPTEPAARAAPNAGARGAILLALVVGLWLVVNAVPRLAAGVQMLRADQVAFDLALGHAVDAAALQRAAEGSQRAIERGFGADAYSAFGLIRLRQAVAGDVMAPLGRRQLGDAVKAERAALMRDPAAPFDWMRLAQASLLLNGVKPELVAPLRMSLRTGAFEPGLLLPRLELAYLLWRDLDAPLRTAVAVQLKVAVQQDPREVAAIARRHYVRQHIREALQGSPRELADFDKAYAALTSTR